MTIQPDTHFLGIRFKPGAFGAFFDFASLHEITDETISFPRRLTPDIRNLDGFFLDRLRQPKQVLSPLITTIHQTNGQISVPDLAKKHFTTVKQLERLFRARVGLTPKAFINFVRFQSAFTAIRRQSASNSPSPSSRPSTFNRQPESQNLAAIAFDHGYYDQAHLANEIKKYTGKPPSMW